MIINSIYYNQNNPIGSKQKISAIFDTALLATWLAIGVILLLVSCRVFSCTALLNHPANVGLMSCISGTSIIILALCLMITSALFWCNKMRDLKASSQNHRKLEDSLVGPPPFEKEYNPEPRYDWQQIRIEDAEIIHSMPIISIAAKEISDKLMANNMPIGKSPYYRDFEDELVVTSTSHPLDDKYFQSFLKHYPGDFANEAQAAFSHDLYVKKLCYGSIFMPDIGTLRIHTQKYYEKYNTIISVVNKNELGALLDNWNLHITQPMYVGIILPLEKSHHVTPILFYFPGNQEKNQVECAILDSVDVRIDVGTLLKQWGISPANIYYTIKQRQADGASCRIGAVTLLRNSLLAIRYHGYTNGLEKALSDGQIEGNLIHYLPPEWDYTEQYSNPYLKEHHLAMRSLMSKKKGKPMETASNHRARFMQEITFTYQFWTNHKSGEIHSSPPQVVTEFIYSQTTSYISFCIQETKSVNTYLKQKGQKMNCL